MDANLVSSKGSLRTYYGEALSELTTAKDFYVVDMDVAGGTGLSGFVKEHGDRVIQCGIAEQAGMGIAAGLSLVGTPVIFNTFAVFGLRAFEIARLSVMFADANVKIALSHVGLDAGEDGASAQSLSHYCVWRSLPNVEVLHPVDRKDMFQAVEYMLNVKHPVVLFTGRSPSKQVYEDPSPPYRYGEADFLLDTDDPEIVIVGAGGIMGEAMEAARKLQSEGTRTCLVNVRSIKPFDDEITRRYKNVYRMVVVEDGFGHCGLYDIITTKLYETAGACDVKSISVRDTFGESGSRDELYEAYGLNSDAIYNMAKEETL